MKKILASLVLLLMTSALVAQPGGTVAPGANTGVARSLSTGASLPATCGVGDVYYKTGAGAGSYNCTASNTWALFAAAGGGLFEPLGTTGIHAIVTTGVHGLAITAGQTLTVTSGGTLGSAAYTAATAYQPAGSYAPSSPSFITQVAEGGLSGEQALSGLASGIMRVATTTGAITSLTTSVGIANNISDETGSGSLMFNSSPAFGGTMQGETPAKFKLWMASATGLTAVPSALGTDLADGVYAITVTGIDWAGGESGYPTATTCTVNNAPAVTGRCAVSWSAIPGAKSYRVYTSLAGDATPSRYFASATAAYNLNTLTGATVAALPAMNTAYSISLDSAGNSWIQGGSLLGPMTLSGQSLTGSMADNLLDLSTTWNTTGAPTGIKMVVTQTAANASSLYIDLQKVGTGSLLKVRQDGRMDVYGDILSTNGNVSAGAGIVNEIRANTGTEVRVGAYGLTGFRICATASNCTLDSSVWVHTSGIQTHTARLEAGTGNETGYTFNYTTNKATSGNDYGLRILWTDTSSPGTSIPFIVVNNSTSSILSQLTDTGAFYSMGSSGAFISQAYSDSNQAALFRGTKYRGTLASPTAALSGDSVWGASGFAYHTDASPAYDEIAAIYMTLTENATHTAGGSQIVFYTTANGAVTPRTAMQIYQDGSTYFGGLDNFDSFRILPIAKGANPFTGTLTSVDLTAARTWTMQDDSGTVLMRNASGHILNTGIAFASLGTPANGTMAYCTDCLIANPCAGAGTGALAKRLNGAWVCN